MKIPLALALLLLASLPANAKEALLSCTVCRACSAVPVRIDYDNSVVTIVFGPQEIKRYRATITPEFIEWDQPNARFTLNRLSGALAVHHFSGSQPMYGRCTSDQRVIP